MRHPKEWPTVVFLFLTVVAGSVLFPAYVAIVAGWPLDYLTSIPILILSAGLAFFASRLCWWGLVLWLVAALAYTAWRMTTGALNPGDLGWPSWLNIILQSSAAALLLAPAMIRWISPFRREANAL